MDPKAAAKSKRSQSHQAKRNHPTPSAAAAHKKKEVLPQANQAHHGGTQRSRRHLRNLPSNWDRYDENIEEVEVGGLDAVRRDTRGPAAAEVQLLADIGGAPVPKSKGADFRYLVEQSRSEAREGGSSGNVMASSSFLDETFPEFAEGLLSMNSAKGENLVSWCTDDNFIVDNDAGSSFEVPFLSVDVNALAAQLSKLNVSQRLFIEEDIPASEMHADSLSEKNSHRFDHIKAKYESEGQLYIDEEALALSVNILNNDVEDKALQSKALEQNDERMSKQGNSHFSLREHRMKQNLISSLESVEQMSWKQSGDSGIDSGMVTDQDSVTKLVSAATEAELDMLLDSLSGINEIAPSTLSSRTCATHNASDQFLQNDVVSSCQEISSSRKTVASVTFNDTVDEILAKCQASSSADIRKDIRNNSSTDMKPHKFSADVYAGSAMGYDNLRHTTVEASIDDLLAETSFFDSFGRSIQSSSDGLPHMNGPYATEDHGFHGASTLIDNEVIDDLLAETSPSLRIQSLYKKHNAP